MADYLETYAETFDLPVELETRVTGLHRSGGRYRLETTDGRRIADHVVVATGAHSTPWIPPFAGDVSEDVFTCHSSEYRNPDQLEPGAVLVVGAGNSGTQIAADIASDGNRQVWLAGRDTGRLPRRLLGRDIYRWLEPTLFRIRRSSYLGRRIHERTADSGDLVFGDEFERMQAAGVERVGRITAVESDRPVTAEGDSFDVGNVVWATGFQPEYPWIDLDVFEPDGEPRHTRGVVDEAPRLYFAGLRWQSRLSSSLIGGVGSDARHVVDHIRRSGAE